jgi:hypothetical protein
MMMAVIMSQWSAWAAAATDGRRRLAKVFACASGLEVLWYIWSVYRRHRLLAVCKTAEMRMRCLMLHKPLCVVIPVCVWIAGWREYRRRATGAVVYAIPLQLSGGSATYTANIWVWAPPTISASPSTHQPPLIAFPGAGFGAAPYAWFLRGAARRLHTTVMCLEDPSAFAAHPWYSEASIPNLDAWLQLYDRACAMLATGAHAAHPGPPDIWSHSNGSLIAAMVCARAVTPPRRAVFYEPTAVNNTWCAAHVDATRYCADIWGSISYRLVICDEGVVRFMRTCSQHQQQRSQRLRRHEIVRYDEDVACPTTQLTSPLRRGVQYIIDTSDDDRVIDTNTAARLLTYNVPRMAAWDTHKGTHGDRVAGAGIGAPRNMDEAVQWLTEHLTNPHIPHTSQSVAK